jgi:DNA repair protein RadD
MQLRDYQSAAVAAVWRCLCEQPGNPLLVMPTGSGKSPVIGSLCQTAIEKYGGRVIVLAHRKELLEQNAEKIRAFLPEQIPTGIYSAGLKRYATEEAVICAGIQSVHGKAELFGSRQLVLIDEAHLVPDAGEGMYRTFLDDLREINPRLRVVGLTATPYRTSTGTLVGPAKIFQRVCHETPVRQLIDANWLCPLVTKPAESSVDTSKLHVSRGEFDARESEKLFDATDKVRAACEEIAIATAARRSVLVFCQGVEHASHVAEILEHILREQVGLVVGNTSPLERSTTLRRFRSREIRVVVNCDVLTTGFDAPNIDAICVLRATLSPGLFAQMVGRGLRLAEEKKDCLVLDFGQNVERHGKLDDPEYGRKKKQKREGELAGEAVTKVCPNCECELHGSATECECGWLFPRELKHERKAADEELLGHISEPEWFIVTAINYTRHSKKKNPENKPDTMRVDYECEREAGENMGEVISEWICIEHAGFARKGAVKWWKKRSELPTPATIDEALDTANNADEWFEPTRIKAHKEGRFWKIDEVELALREVAFEFGGHEENF